MRSNAGKTTMLLCTLLLLAATLAGCGAGEGAEEPPSNPNGQSSEPTASAADTPTADAGTTGDRVRLDELEVGLEPIARGFDQPLFVTGAGDGTGRLFVVEQPGRIRVVKGGRVSPRAFLDVRDRVSTGGERGLLGLVFAPDYKDSGRFYVNYTDRQGGTVVARYVADDPESDTPSLTGPEVVLEVDQPYANHNGGCLMFAPDGRLWVGMGDGGSAGDPEGNAQSGGSPLGKMLALDVEGTSGRPKPEVIASGLRNPWRYSFDPETDDVWVGDVGQNAWEEIDRISFAEFEGSNFGWDRWEGNHAYPPGSNRSKTGFVFPVLEYDHGEGQSVTGGYVYRGSAYPSLEGCYFYADFVSGWIAVAREKDGSNDLEQRTVLGNTGVTPSSFGVDDDGELYVCDYNGALLKVTAR